MTPQAQVQDHDPVREGADPAAAAPSRTAQRDVVRTFSELLAQAEAVGQAQANLEQRRKEAYSGLFARIRARVDLHQTLFLGLWRDQLLHPLPARGARSPISLFPPGARLVEFRVDASHIHADVEYSSPVLGTKGFELDVPLKYLAEDGADVLWAEAAAAAQAQLRDAEK